MPPCPRLRSLAAVAIGAGLVTACGGSGGTGACGPITREALDPAYLVHVVGDDEGVEYLSDPPTSGPHQPGPAVEGVVEEPLPRPVQVGVLERGDVLIQHQPDLGAPELDELERLAGERVVVAPNPSLEDPVVVTAWVFTRTCDAVDVEDLDEFIRARVGKGPEG